MITNSSYGQGFHSNRHGRSILPDSLRWLWRDYKPDDPHAWLEDVTGQKPLAWVKERNAESTGELTSSERSGRSTRGSSRSSTPTPVSRRSQKHRPLLLQLLAGCARTRAALAADHARRISQSRSPPGRSCSTSTPWARKRTRTGSGTAPAAQTRATSVALISLSRGGADASVVREFDLTTRTFVKDGLHAARGQEPGRLARPTAFSWAPTSARDR